MQAFDKAPSMPDSAKFQRLDWIDYARLIGAICVMLGHYCYVAVSPMINNRVTSYGWLTDVFSNGGVAVFFFFMASGLVITIASEPLSASEFLIRRIARVYPTYLLCLGITAFAAHFGPQIHPITLAGFLADVLMAAPLAGYHHVDPVYWSLAIEMQFYFAIYVLKLIGLMARPQRVTVIWTVLLLANFFLRAPIPLLGKYYYFLVAGMILSFIYRDLNLRLNYALLAAIAPICLFSAFGYARSIDINPLTFVLLTASLFVLFLALKNWRKRLPFAARIGSMSYPLYLLHFHIGLVLIYRFGTDSGKYVLVGLICAGMFLVSFGLDDLVEFRLRHLWMRLSRQSFGWIGTQSAGMLGRFYCIVRAKSLTAAAPDKRAE